MAKQEFSTLTLAEQLQTEADAYEFLERLRWAGQPVCPHCHTVGHAYFLNPRDGGEARATRTGSMSQRRVWKCGKCRRQFSVLTGTIFHGSKIPVRTWVLVIWEMCTSKNGVAAREIERKYSLTPKSAWFLLHRIREAMKRDPLATMLRGTVIADETFIGGKPANRHADKRDTAQPKQPVVALIDFETREVRSRVVPDVTALTLRGAIADNVEMKSTQLWSDSTLAYKSIAKGMHSHRYVNHEAGVWKLRGSGATTNMAENFFSQLKRSIDGTHHHVSRTHLHRYLAQFDWLYTNCRKTDSYRMRLLLARVGGRRLTYKPLRDAWDLP